MEKMKKIYKAPSADVVEINAHNVLCISAPRMFWVLDGDNVSTTQEWVRDDYGTADIF